MSSKKIYKLEEAAQLLALHPDAIKSKIQSGRIKADQNYNIDRDDVDLFYKSMGGDNLQKKELCLKASQKLLRFVESSFGHVESAKRYLDDGADPNFIVYGYDYSPTILMCAIACGVRENERLYDIIELLIERGADPNRVNELGENALNYAFTNGTLNRDDFFCQKKLINLLLDNGAYVNLRTFGAADSEPYLPIHYAIVRDDLIIFEKILKKFHLARFQRYNVKSLIKEVMAPEKQNEFLEKMKCVLGEL